MLNYVSCIGPTEYVLTLYFSYQEFADAVSKITFIIIYSIFVYLKFFHVSTRGSYHIRHNLFGLGLHTEARGTFYVMCKT